MILRALLFCSVVTACPSTARDAASPIGTSTPAGVAPPVFNFDSLDARLVSSDAFRGKTSVISFITTWDIPSQAQVVYLVKMSEHDGEAVNYAIIALQDPSGRELVEQYARVLHVTFPTAMGDTSMLTTEGPLGDVHNVPTTVILDAGGRVVYRSSGVIKSDELRAHMPR